MWIDIYYDNCTQAIFCGECGRTLKYDEKVTRFCSECGANCTNENGHPTSKTINLVELINKLKDNTLIELYNDIECILNERRENKC